MGTMLASKRGSLHSTSDVSKTAIERNCSIDIQFRLLQNIEGGRYLIPDENCKFEAEKLDEIPV
jgi:hypothetical protein